MVEDAGGTGGVEMIERLTGASHKELGFHSKTEYKEKRDAACPLKPVEDKEVE